MVLGSYVPAFSSLGCTNHLRIMSDLKHGFIHFGQKNKVDHTVQYTLSLLSTWRFTSFLPFGIQQKCLQKLGSPLLVHNTPSLMSIFVSQDWQRGVEAEEKLGKLWAKNRPVVRDSWTARDLFGWFFYHRFNQLAWNRESENSLVNLGMKQKVLDFHFL